MGPNNGQRDEEDNRTNVALVYRSVTMVRVRCIIIGLRVLLEGWLLVCEADTGYWNAIQSGKYGNHC